MNLDEESCGVVAVVVRDACVVVSNDFERGAIPVDVIAGNAVEVAFDSLNGGGGYFVSNADGGHFWSLV